jgi:hypothetical protein
MHKDIAVWACQPRPSSFPLDQLLDVLTSRSSSGGNGGRCDKVHTHPMSTGHAQGYSSVGMSAQAFIIFTGPASSRNWSSGNGGCCGKAHTHPMSTGHAQGHQTACACQPRPSSFPLEITRCSYIAELSSGNVERCGKAHEQHVRLCPSPLLQVGMF